MLPFHCCLPLSEAVWKALLDYDTFMVKTLWVLGSYENWKGRCPLFFREPQHPLLHGVGYLLYLTLARFLSLSHSSSKSYCVVSWSSDCMRITWCSGVKCGTQTCSQKAVNQMWGGIQEYAGTGKKQLPSESAHQWDLSSRLTCIACEHSFKPSGENPKRQFGPISGELGWSPNRGTTVQNQNLCVIIMYVTTNILAWDISYPKHQMESTSILHEHGRRHTQAAYIYDGSNWLGSHFVGWMSHLIGWYLCYVIGKYLYCWNSYVIFLLKDKILVTISFWYCVFFFFFFLNQILWTAVREVIQLTL